LKGKRLRVHLTYLLNIQRLPYHEGRKLMQGLVEVKRRSHQPEVLMMVEHEPVLTLGRRGVDSDVLVSQEVLVKKGITTHRVERGGLTTYHGPGQLVVYPIFDVRAMGMGVRDLVYSLEQVVIDTLAVFGLEACRKAGYPGVWFGADKIASLGLAIRGGISFHGIALNCATDLGNFDLIRPCGLDGVCMTSMEKVLGERIDPNLLRKTMAGHFAGRFNLELVGWSLAQACELISCSGMHDIKSEARGAQ
jgi:lipoate-protein ligase B